MNIRCLVSIFFLQIGHVCTLGAHSMHTCAWPHGTKQQLRGRSMHTTHSVGCSVDVGGLGRLPITKNPLPAGSMVAGLCALGITSCELA